MPGHDYPLPNSKWVCSGARRLQCVIVVVALSNVRHLVSIACTIVFLACLKRLGLIIPGLCTMLPLYLKESPRNWNVTINTAGHTNTVYFTTVRLYSVSIDFLDVCEGAFIMAHGLPVLLCCFRPQAGGSCAQMPITHCLTSVDGEVIIEVAFCA